MAALSDLDQSLEALRQLKPPGVSKSRVAAITTLFVENVQYEAILVNRIVSHLQSSPATHKLGILYVVDAVIREWLEHASKMGLSLSGHAASDGSYAAGVNHFTDHFPLIMNDVVSYAPEDQKEKIVKLIDIWLAGNVFPHHLLLEYKNRMQHMAPNNAVASFTNGATGYTTSLTQATPRVVGPEIVDARGESQHSRLINQATVAASNGATNGYTLTPTSLPATNGKQSQMTTGGPPDPQALVTYMQWLQELSQRGVPSEEWPAVLAVLQEQARTATRNDPEQSKSKSQSRERSRSPKRRPSPAYEPYEGGGYRSRTPERNSSPSKQADKILLNDRPKWISLDPSIPRDHIKVLSRTLFVGGNTYTENQLRDLFTRFGEVQSCVPNHIRKHAFVKMVSHEQAVKAKEAMGSLQDPEILRHVRQTKWGVGFGPRECCNYDKGYSVIPIERLTEADKRWVLTAEYGGTGGKPLASGMVMEEPDIEIGAGVSSKAISKRPSVPSPGTRPLRQPSRQPPRVGRRPESNQRAPQPQTQQFMPPITRSMHFPEHFESNTVGVPPAVPGFGFQLPGTFS